MNRVCIAVCLASLAVACAAPTPGDDDPLVAPLVDPGSPEEAGILAFLHDGATTFELLDDDVGLDRRAARGLIDARPFADIDAVDAVPYVGTVALQTLLDWAREHGWIDGAATDRDAAILDLVNDAATTFALLDDAVGLDRRAAENIMDARPFASVSQLDGVPWVGPSALDLLAAYALANGYGADAPSPAEVPCAVFSEYTEGQGANNKAFEVFNCGDAPVDGAALGVCLVRNDETTCSVGATLAGATVAPGGVRTACKARGGTLFDPYESLSAACDVEVGAVANFNGDDRLVLFFDADGDGARSADDPVLDTFGNPAWRPSTPLYSEATFRRCDLTPRAGGYFDVDALFTRHDRHDHSDLGVAPSADCGARPPASEGEACVDSDQCVGALRCQGIPHDGSGDEGRCVDPAPIPGDGDRCDRWAPCAEGLICAGWTLWGEGHCVPQWMAGRFEADIASPYAIGDAPSGGIASSVVVSGLASVPVDLEVTVHVEHPRPADLVITLIDPNGARSVLWDRASDFGGRGRSFVTTGEISRDDNVNGRWQLRVEDEVTGEAGTLNGWTLFVVSRWD